MVQTAAQKRAYQRKYYKDNRKARLAYKRKRYATVKDYRDAAKFRAKLRNSLNAVVTRRLKLRVVHAGREENAYYLVNMEPLVNRSRDALYYWRSKGDRILPLPLYHESGKAKRALYSASQVQFIAELLVMLDQGVIDLSYRGMGHVLREIWHKKFSVTALNAGIRVVRRGKYYKQDKEEDSKDGTYQEKREKRIQNYKDVFSRKKKAPRV